MLLLAYEMLVSMCNCMALVFLMLVSSLLDTRKSVSRYMLMVLVCLLLVHWKLVSKFQKMELVFLMLGKVWLDILKLATMRLGLKL